MTAHNFLKGEAEAEVLISSLPWPEIGQEVMTEEVQVGRKENILQWEDGRLLKQAS